VVEVTHRFTPYSKGLEGRVKKECQAAGGDDPTIDTAKVLGAPGKDVLELLFDGKVFKPTPKSAAIMRAL
jgi:hypothetical protein